MSWVDTLIAGVTGGAAAVLGAVFGARAAIVQNRETLKSSGTQLTNQLQGELDRSRDERAEQRFREAYKPLLSYLHWSQHMNILRRRILERQRDAVDKCRREHPLANKDEQSDLQWREFWDAGDTENEREEIDAGPTSRESADLLGLVDAFAGDQVRDAFLKVLKCQTELRTVQDQVRREVLRRGLIEDYPLAAALINRDPILIGSPEQEAKNQKAAAEVAKSLHNSDVHVALRMLTDKGVEYDGFVNNVIDDVRKDIGNHISVAPNAGESSN